MRLFGVNVRLASDEQPGRLFTENHCMSSMCADRPLLLGSPQRYWTRPQDTTVEGRTPPQANVPHRWQPKSGMSPGNSLPQHAGFLQQSLETRPQGGPTAPALASQGACMVQLLTVALQGGGTRALTLKKARHTSPFPSFRLTSSAFHLTAGMSFVLLSHKL